MSRSALVCVVTVTCLFTGKKSNWFINQLNCAEVSQVALGTKSIQASFLRRSSSNCQLVTVEEWEIEDIRSIVLVSVAADKRANSDCLLRSVSVFSDSARRSSDKAVCHSACFIAVISRAAIRFSICFLFLEQEITLSKFKMSLAPFKYSC